MEIYLGDDRQNDYELTVVEGEEDQVVGYLSFGPAPLTAGAFNLYWIAVAPDCQSRGYGGELVKWMEKQVLSRAGRLVVIETSSQAGYGATRDFYRRRGYRLVSRIADFYKPGDDRLSYAKYFPPGGSSR
jgi:ribosomal protein S18 acetylase RimI-like enzyme